MTTSITRLAWLCLLACSNMALAEPRLPAVRQGKVFVRLSPDAFADLQKRPIRYEDDIRDTILGTAVRGRCVTTGNVTLQPNPQDRGLLLVVKGECVTTSVGENGPATIHSTTTTAFVATSRIFYDEDYGFRADEVQVGALTRINTDGIEAAQKGLVGRIVRNVAERRVEEAKPIAAEIGRQKAVARIQSAVSGQLEAKLAQVNRSMERLRAIVTILQPELTEKVCLRAYEEQLVLYFQDESNDLSALFRELPELKSTCGLWVHQSGVDQDLKRQLEGFATVRDTANMVVNNAKKLILPDPSLKAGAVRKEVVAEEPWLREHGDWFMIRVPATLVKDGGRASAQDQVTPAATPR